MTDKLCFILILGLCGLSSTHGRESFIVNGEEAEEGAWPWQGSLRFASSNYHTCGCVFIHEMYALTAGHCIGGSIADYRVVFGTNDHPYRRRQPEERSLADIVVHPGFENICIDERCFPDDIAILTFSEPIMPSDVIQPIAMDTGVDRTNQLCYITGFGDLEGNGDRPERLMQARMNVLSDDECRYFLYNLENLYTPEWHVCVFSPDGESEPNPAGLCNGDSGGPMHCSPDSGDTWELVGLASWMIVSGAGVPCMSSYSSVYTRVSTYRQWVCDNTEGVC